MIIVANFKAHKNNSEVISWIEKFNQLQNNFSGNSQLEIVLCPSYVSLAGAFQKINSLTWKIKISLGAQNISAFEEGPYTGEVTVKMIKDYVNYVIVGHSERRRYFSETNDSISQKVMLLKKEKITPILCVSQINEVNPLGDFEGLLAFEPVFAIGSGTPDSIAHINDFVKKAKELLKNARVLYGGSVAPENVSKFSNNKNLYGLFVGSASLDPVVFANIVSHASKN